MEKYFLSFLFWSMSISVFAQSELIRPKPEPAIFVNDYVGVLSPQENNDLENKLKDFDKTTSNQFAIVILPSLEGKQIEVIANQWFKTWGIGQKDKNNGVLVLIAIQDRKMRIEVGYGLNDIITDERAKYVITNYLQPNFKEQKFYTGLDEGIAYLMGLAIQKFPPQQTPLNPNDSLAENNNTYFFEVLGVLGIGLLVFLLLEIFYFRPKRKQQNLKNNTIKSKSYTSNYSKNNSTNNQNNNNHSNNYSSTYYYSSDGSSSSNDSSSSSDSSSYGGGDSGGGGSSGDW
jgi:uncharacterized protein